jgi:hypothetical protein
MYWRIFPSAAVARALTVGLAAPSLAEIQTQVRFLEEEAATTAAEGKHL